MIHSEKYIIDDKTGTIKGVAHRTSLADFLKCFETEDVLAIYGVDGKLIEDTTRYIRSGMSVKHMAEGKKLAEYQIRVNRPAETLLPKDALDTVPTGTEQIQFICLDLMLRESILKNHTLSLARAITKRVSGITNIVETLRKGWIAMISVGGGNYIIHKQEYSKEDYLQYLKSLEKDGFVKYADNGAGIDRTVFSSTYIKDEMIVHVTYFLHEKRMSISFYEGTLSEHLCYQDSYVKDNDADAKTTMRMLELFRLGNSFVFQLKNGHFIISDGGLAADLPYLLDYLEGLTKEGEKPIIEAWFITHAHGDHCGAFCQFSKRTEWMDRVVVDGVYYSSPNEEKVLGICGCEILDYEIRWVTRRLKNQNGETTKLYRPQTGQRYYFNDITIDILLSQEQLSFGAFRKDLNTSSTVCLITIDGQRCFFSGDIQEEGLEWLMRNYPQECLAVDFFTLNHHGMNLSMEFADYMTAKTMLLTVRDDVPIRRLRETKLMCTKAEESVVWGDGTKVFTFPYEVGNYETLPQLEWIYNEGQERLPQPNLYTCPGKCLQGWLFDADNVLFDGEELKQGAKELLLYLKERRVLLSAFSALRTDELKKKMCETGIQDCFELLMGVDELDANIPYLDAAQKTEKLFDLEHIYNYVVVSDSMDVVREVIRDGFKTLVPTWGEEIGEELKLKCWHTFETLDTIYDFFEIKQVYFE